MPPDMDLAGVVKARPGVDWNPYRQPQIWPCGVNIMHPSVNLLRDRVRNELSDQPGPFNFKRGREDAMNQGSIQVENMIKNLMARCPECKQTHPERPR